MNLRLGSTGDDVKTVQAALRSLGFYPAPARIDGGYGPLTERAVREFQAARSLVADGVVGPKTWTALLVPVPRAAYPMPRCWPLRCLPDGRTPRITSGHKARNGERTNHNGVDLMYPYRPSDPPMPIGDSGRTKTWWIPPGAMAIAPFAGQIVLAGDSPTGHRVWLRHTSGWCAGFFHLSELAVSVGQWAGIATPIGRVGDSPRGDDPDHLHFELLYGDVVDIIKRGLYPHGTVDPQLMLELTPFLPAL